MSIFLKNSVSSIPALASRRLTGLSGHFIRSMASQSLPKTMKGVIIEKTGGTEVLQYKTDLAVPEPKDGQVLVKNDYVGINYIDTYVYFPTR
jgi:hypothetical protein